MAGTQSMTLTVHVHSEVKGASDHHRAGVRSLTNMIEVMIRHYNDQEGERIAERATEPSRVGRLSSYHTKKTMGANDNRLENRLWDAADEFRANSRLRASEYSIPVLEMIFLRYADVKFAEGEKKIGEQDSGRRRSTVGKIHDLFPKLISGELDVSELDIDIGEAA